MKTMVRKQVDEKIKECFPKIEEIMMENSGLMAANSLLQAALEAERKNRCCGNCYYFLVHLTWQGRLNTICVNEKSEVIYREKCSPACDHWRSCRG